MLDERERKEVREIEDSKRETRDRQREKKKLLIRKVIQDTEKKENKEQKNKE